MTDADCILFRAITIDAPPPDVFRWLCQLRMAPYSYDWIDNLGRRSPRELVAGLDQLAVGQKFMRIFTLVSFAPDGHVTILADHTIFGEIAVTYRVQSHPQGSRLAVKLRVRSPRAPIGYAVRHLLPAGDLLMMRKQLITIATLASGD